MTTEQAQLMIEYLKTLTTEGAIITGCVLGATILFVVVAIDTMRPR